MTNTERQQRITALKAELDQVYSVMPNTFAELDRQNQAAFIISRDIEKLENPLGYNENHWEGYEMVLK